MGRRNPSYSLARGVGKRTYGVSESVLNNAMRQLGANWTPFGEPERREYPPELKGMHIRSFARVHLQPIVGPSHDVDIFVGHQMGWEDKEGHDLTEEQAAKKPDAKRKSKGGAAWYPFHRMVLVFLPRWFRTKEQFNISMNRVRMRRTLAHELTHVLDPRASEAVLPYYELGPTSVSGLSHQRTREENQYTYYNEPGEVIARRHEIFRELNRPALAKDLRQLAVTSLEHVKKMDERLAKEGLYRKVPWKLERLVTSHNLTLFMNKSAVWRRINPYLSGRNKGKITEMARRLMLSHLIGESEPVRMNPRQPIGKTITMLLRGDYGYDDAFEHNVAVMVEQHGKKAVKQVLDARLKKYWAKRKAEKYPSKSELEILLHIAKVAKLKVWIPSR